MRVRIWIWGTLAAVLLAGVLLTAAGIVYFSLLLVPAEVTAYGPERNTMRWRPPLFLEASHYLVSSSEYPSIEVLHEFVDSAGMVFTSDADDSGFVARVSVDDSLSGPCWIGITACTLQGRCGREMRVQCTRLTQGVLAQ